MASKDLYIIPECYVDTNMVETLLNSFGSITAGVNHQKGCNNVTKILREKFKGQFGIGIVDNDKVKTGIIIDFKKIWESKHIAVLKHPDENHYVFAIKPAMDMFILDSAAEQGVNLNEIGFPDNLKKFTDITKRITSKDDAKIKNLIKAIRNNAEIKAFANALVYLKTNQGSSDENIVKDFFLSVAVD
ncbi:MAG: hypothetical protein M0P12_09965 [Paludibacteraceae bacterium]|nr:hypothetical protein [Paludibacteraceae bacterium]